MAILVLVTLALFANIVTAANGQYSQIIECLKTRTEILTGQVSCIKFVPYQPTACHSKYKACPVVTPCKECSKCMSLIPINLLISIFGDPSVPTGSVVEETCSALILYSGWVLAVVVAVLAVAAAVYYRDLNKTTQERSSSVQTPVPSMALRNAFTMPDDLPEPPEPPVVRRRSPSSDPPAAPAEPRIMHLKTPPPPPVVIPQEPQANDVEPPMSPPPLRRSARSRRS